jgi:hypothetical protein
MRHSDGNLTGYILYKGSVLLDESFTDLRIPVFPVLKPESVFLLLLLN